MHQVNGRGYEGHFQHPRDSESPVPIYLKIGMFDNVQSANPYAQYGGHHTGGG